MNKGPWPPGAEGSKPGPPASTEMIRPTNASTCFVSAGLAGFADAGRVHSTSLGATPWGNSGKVASASRYTMSAHSGPERLSVRPRPRLRPRPRPGPRPRLRLRL